MSSENEAKMSDAGNVVCVLGAKWGDEGKGKLVDYLLEKRGIDVCARFKCVATHKKCAACAPQQRCWAQCADALRTATIAQWRQQRGYGKGGRCARPTRG